MASILIIDDERPIRNTLKEILEYEKYQDETRALRSARRIAERSKYTFMNGVYEDGEERQARADGDG